MECNSRRRIVRDEIERALRISDMLTSCYSNLRDQYARRALILDLAILVASVWLVAMAFVDPEIAQRFSVPGLTATTTIGLLAVLTFILSIFQLRTDWKYKAERFDQAAKTYAWSKGTLRAVLSDNPLDQGKCQRSLSDYQAIGQRVVAVPENKFNRLKKKHLMKVRISQMLDGHNGTNMFIIRIRIWFVDTFKTLGSTK